MGRGWKRVALDADTAPVPYPTPVLQIDQATSADQGVLRNQRERGEDINLDRDIGFRTRCSVPAFGGLG